LPIKLFIVLSGSLCFFFDEKELMPEARQKARRVNPPKGAAPSEDGKTGKRVNILGKKSRLLGLASRKGLKVVQLTQ
jgi:hypothetical protein